MKNELSKREKAIMRQLIDKGLEADFAQALKEAENIIDQWRLTQKTNREAFHELLDGLKTYRKFLAQRYDGITGSGYLPTAITIYRDKLITEDDLQELREDLREHIIRLGSIVY
jgi:hypothetical protein